MQTTPGCPSNISEDLPWPYFMCTVFSYFVPFPTLQHLSVVFSREKFSVSIMQSLVHLFFSISPISISLPVAFSVRTFMVTNSFLMLIHTCERFVSHLKTRMNLTEIFNRFTEKCGQSSYAFELSVINIWFLLRVSPLSHNYGHENIGNDHRLTECISYGYCTWRTRNL